MHDEVSPSEYARRVGANTRSVQRWIALGKLPARRVGGRWRVASDAFVASEPTRSGIRLLFIANRGEIARRIRRTAERVGVEVVEPATEGPLAVDLLDVGAVVEAARAAGADAVHPGFGFLAENADFAAAVEAAGLIWIGPPPAAIRAMGDKGAARRLALEHGVPVVPGYDGEDQTDAALRRAARRIGYPLLVKPAAGGGGKGMRVVRDPARLVDALAGARREATAAFGDERLILERLVEGARHVEVQVLFDAAGAGLHLGERDCSTQRRHQKVLEETPSPAMTPAIRRRLTSHALELATAVGYRSAGTCEFLLTNRREVFFLEMNTRLQVEHPVTELVTGVDLVEQQLRIAEGLPIALRQPDVDLALERGGHAVEVRLYAEDAEAGFLPATGPVELLRWPSGPGIRIDAGIDEGDVVSARFDPMLAKVMAHGRDRAEALDRLTAALDDTTVLGLTTNLRFLRWLVRSPALRDGQMRIDTLDRIWPPDGWDERSASPDAAWRAAARGLAGTGWQGGWRLNAPARVRLTAEGETRPVPVTSPAEGTEPAMAVVGDTAHVDVAGRSIAFSIAPSPDVDRAARAATAHGGGGPVEIVAPMPGSILAVHASSGAAVAAGDPIVTLEAMKMEHRVTAPNAGRVAEVRARSGDQVARGDVLALLEP
ncbi:MAG TPA: biotin carboxylase N-terminal domain-containing protein [Patescibacteria group bacterium]|nr:biotin carboxylase N-terminal domain-containing protein [Patescibacteria group bacterium]